MSLDSAAFRSLPSVDRLLHSQELAGWVRSYRRDPVVRVVREVLAGYRESRSAGGSIPDYSTIVDRIAVELAGRWSAPRRVINATGVILHTNLGRAPLSQAAIEAMQNASLYSDLELELSGGERGSRQRHLRNLLCDLLGAESALVTVNNASALLLASTALCTGKDVLISRGEAVEIGDGFRILDILRQSGCRVVEVGATNRTRLQDFENAVGPRTGALLHVHPSNFRMVGFTESVPLPALASLAGRHGVPLIVDNGSGSLLDTATYGLAHEPMPAEALDAGADLVSFSADKLLGGPQAGILVGRTELIAKLTRHPLARAVRIDKIAVAGLAATLLAYLRGDAPVTLPVCRMISQTSEEIGVRCAAWIERAAACGIPTFSEAGESTVGGGSIPGATLPTRLIALPPGVTAASLRSARTAVVARSREGRVLLDLRTVPAAEEESLLAAVRDVIESKNHMVDSTAE